MDGSTLYYSAQSGSSQSANFRKRMIFPSLHGLSPPKEQQPIMPVQQHNTIESKHIRQRGLSIDLSDLSDASPTDVREINHRPSLLRANSLDGLMVPMPMPKLSVSDNKKALNILNRRTNTKDQTNQAARPAPQGTLAPSNKSLNLFGGVNMKHRAYYYPASVPTPINTTKSPSISTQVKPPTPILRIKRTYTESQSSSQRHLSYTSGESFSESSSSSSNLSPSVPTLASPASIKSLHSRDHELEGSKSDQQEGIGDSEYDIERINKDAKILPRSKPCKMKKSQSDQLVSQNEDEEFLSSSRPRRKSISNEKDIARRKSVSRHVSLETFNHKRHTSFDPHITVFQFPVSDFEKKGGEKWFTEDELTEFKQEAIQRIRMRSTPKVIYTGTGRIVTVGNKANASITKPRPAGSIFFNHPALQCDDDDDETKVIRSSSSRKSEINNHLSQEIRNILVVDPHEIFLALFTKSLNHLIPHAAVATARSTKEALTRIEAAQRAFDRGATLGFDVIIIEERLWSNLPVQQLVSQPAGDQTDQKLASLMVSGSALIKELLESGSNGGNPRLTLIVGASSRQEDIEKLTLAGADLVWGKPPPEMNSSLKKDLLKLLMQKRKRSNVDELFD